MSEGVKLQRKSRPVNMKKGGRPIDFKERLNTSMMAREKNERVKKALALPMPGDEES